MYILLVIMVGSGCASEQWNRSFRVGNRNLGLTGWREQVRKLPPLRPNIAEDYSTVIHRALQKPENTTTLQRNNEKAEPRRDSRFFFPNLFTVVRFENTACDSGSNQNGTCFTAADCTRRGGKATTSCAQGYGVCCIFQLTCGSSTNTNNTYFVNQNYPSAFDGTGFCQMTIQRINNGICQFRLDFDELILAPPDSDGSCQSDQLVISGGSNIPVICGSNTGQHVYVNVGTTGGSTTLTMVTSGAAFSRVWNIRISQIPCNASYSAPVGCVQYFPDIAGEIKTFNYDLSSGQHLSNQQYSICIRAEAGFCGVTYSQCADSVNTDPQSFSLTGDPTGNAQSGAGSGSCDTDWINIACVTDVAGSTLNSNNDICEDRVCGSELSSINNDNNAPKTIYSYSRPFIIHVHTDADEDADSNNRGFCLNFVQQPCTSTSTG